jgi:hypothetical protein
VAVRSLNLEILPVAGGIMGDVLKNVAAVVLDDFTPFELGVACEVFGVDRRDDGLPAYDFAVVAGEPPADVTAGPARLARPVCADLGTTRAFRR